MNMTLRTLLLAAFVRGQNCPEECARGCLNKSSLDDCLDLCGCCLGEQVTGGRMVNPEFYSLLNSLSHCRFDVRDRCVVENLNSVDSCIQESQCEVPLTEKRLGSICMETCAEFCVSDLHCIEHCYSGNCIENTSTVMKVLVVLNCLVLAIACYFIYRVVLSRRRKNSSVTLLNYSSF